jgi:RhtB (resistance to homoserine/threonine) family protein
MTHYLPEFFLLYIANFINLVSPGAGFAIVVRNSSVHSRKAGILTGLGICASSFIHKAYTFMGFGLVVSRSPILFNTIKWAGCAFLLYLGYQCFKNSRKKPAREHHMAVSQDLSASQAFRMGFFTDLLNPQASLSFIVLVTATVSPDTPITVQGLYGLALISTSLVWYTTVALFFSNSYLQRAFQGIRQWLDRLMGSVLIGLGIRLALISAR